MNKLREKLKVPHIIGGVFAIIIICFIILGNRKVDAATTQPYLIKINKQQNVLTIYKKDKAGKHTIPVKAMTCSTGWGTPIGTFKTPAKYRWKLLDGDVWGQYSTRIVKGILFHSVWYYELDASTLSAKQYNKLGTTASHGCVRLTVEDAKWIYDNCPLGTTVTIYNSKNPGPLGKPEAIKLIEGTGWDPTDIFNINNPYNGKKPTILGAKNKTVKYGDKVNLKKGITAKSTTGLYITGDVKVKGKVDTKKPGPYKITYHVTDILGRKATKTITYKVLDNPEIPVITGVVDRIVSPKQVIDRAFALEGIKAKAGKETLDIKKIKTIITNNGDETYTIKYSLTTSNGKKDTATSLITVDSEAPQLLGIENKEIAWDTMVDNEFALEGVEITDNYSDMKQSDIKVEIVDNNDSTYTITYQAMDEVGNKTVESTKLIITDWLKIEGATDKTVSFDYFVSDYYLRQGVTATDHGENITWKLTITIAPPVDNIYKVTYSVKDDLGHEEVVNVLYTVDVASNIS